MRSVAIIGSNSFLAKNFIKYSVDQHKEYSIDCYDLPKKSSDSSKDDFVEIDFSDRDSVRKINLKVDIVLIFIGRTGTVSGFDEYKSFIYANEICLLNILDEYNTQGSTARIIYPGSRLIYAAGGDEPVDEDSATDCRSIYAITKLAAENYLRLYKRCFGLEFAILRICTPIGTLVESNGSYGTFEIFEHQAKNAGTVTIYGSGRQRKTFTSISDVCKGFCLLIDAEKIEHDTYNLGGQELCLDEVARAIAARYDADVNHIAWPSMAKKVDGGSVIMDSSRFDTEFQMTYERVL